MVVLQKDFEYPDPSQLGIKISCETLMYPGKINENVQLQVTFKLFWPLIFKIHIIKYFEIGVSFLALVFTVSYSIYSELFPGSELLFKVTSEWPWKLLSSFTKQLHRPGIEPGPPAWQASILPLNQRCSLVWNNELMTFIALENGVKDLVIDWNITVSTWSK